VTSLHMNIDQDQGNCQGTAALATRLSYFGFGQLGRQFLACDKFGSKLTNGSDLFSANRVTALFDNCQAANAYSLLQLYCGWIIQSVETSKISRRRAHEFLQPVWQARSLGHLLSLSGKIFVHIITYLCPSANMM
jgi:hypothetical protein